MKHHIEEELWPLHTEEPLEDYQVPRTANGEKLGNTLNDSQNDGFKKSNGTPLYDLDQDAKSLNPAEHNSGYNAAGHQDPDHIGNNKPAVAEAQEVGTQGAGV